MPPLHLFDYTLDEQNFEIFPEQIWQNKYVIYHGTAAYHSPVIERDGIQLKTPFDIPAAKKLIELLKREDISPFDVPKSILRSTTAEGLAAYIYGIEHGELRLSFSHLSYICAQFASGSLKGGQSLHYIIEAQDIVTNAIQSNPAFQDEIDGDVTELFAEVATIRASEGVVYAIEVPHTLDGLELQNGVIHSYTPIPKDWLIGKVHIPNDFDLNLYPRSTVNQRNISKLTQNRFSLGVLIDKKNYPEDFEE